MSRGDNVEPGVAGDFALYDGSDGGGMPKGGSNTLVFAPRSSETEREACADLSAIGGKNAAAVLVSYAQQAQRRFRTWREGPDGRFDDVAVISVGERRQSNSTTTVGEGTVSVRSIGDRSDLIRLGIAINDALSERDAAGTVLCFHTVTDLIEFVGEEQAFRFFYTLIRQVETVGARAHYHMDPAAHDEQTVIKFRSLFDDVVTPGNEDTIG